MRAEGSLRAEPGRGDGIADAVRTVRVSAANAAVAAGVRSGPWNDEEAVMGPADIADAGVAFPEPPRDSGCDAVADAVLGPGFRTGEALAGSKRRFRVLGVSALTAAAWIRRRDRVGVMRTPVTGKENADEVGCQEYARERTRSRACCVQRMW